MESGHHCPYLGLKQNRAIRFASPTPEHRCFITGEPQDIPVQQSTFCLSGNHVKCPLYTGEAMPSTQQAAVALPVPASGWRGWLKGLSVRDRRIYAGLVALLGLIILAYIASALIWFSGDDVPPVANATPSPSPSALATATNEASPTLTITATVATPTENPAFLTAVAKNTQTALALSRTPTVTGTPSRTPTLQASPTTFVPFPTDPPIIIIPEPTVPPSDTPVPPSDTPEPPSATPEPPTATPVIDTPVPPTETPEPTLVPPTETPFPTQIVLPTITPLPTETPTGATDQVVLYFADPSGQLLVPVTRRVNATRQPRTAALQELLDGPRDAMVRLIPSDTQLLHLGIHGNLAVANFNRLPTFGSSDHSDIAIRSILLTLTELPGVTQVQLQINGANLGEPRYRPNINPDNSAGLDGQFSTTSFLPLYFPVGDHMVRIMRLIPRTTSEARATVEQMIAGAGPYAGIVSQPWPAGTQVQRLVIVGGTAEVDFNTNVLKTSEQQAVLDSLVLALTTFSSVQRVHVTVDGVALATYWGAEFNGPFLRPTLNPE